MSAIPPTVVIRPAAKWPSVDFAELWSHRELLWFLAWRDVKVRYRQTVIGAAWVALQPLASAAVFTVVFSRFAGTASGKVPYVLFALAGLLPWTFFSGSVAAASNSLVNSSNLVRKVYFPRLLVPAACVIAGLVDLAVSLVAFLGIGLALGWRPDWQLLMLPLALLALLALSLAAGIWLAALNAIYRDVRNLVAFGLQIGLFVTPVIYPISLVPPQWRWLVVINPLTGIVETVRASLFGTPIDWSLFGGVSFGAVCALVMAALVFRRLEGRFVDVV